MQLEMENLTKYFPAFFTFNEDRTVFYGKFSRRLRAFPGAQTIVSVLRMRSFFQTLDPEGVWKMTKDFVSLNFVWKIRRSNFRVILLHLKMVRIARIL